jgi:hypothetical protein
VVSGDDGDDILQVTKLGLMKPPTPLRKIDIDMGLVTNQATVEAPDTTVVTDLSITPVFF